MMTSTIIAKEKSIYLLPALLLLAAIVMAAFFRFFRLDQIPPGFTFDEASHALDALDILNGRLMLISPRLQETPAGYMYFVAGAFQLFGPTPLVQRAVSAAFGALMIPAGFFAAREWFREEGHQKATWIAVFSSLLLSTSFWAVITSRKGFEYIVPPVFALTSVYFFWRGYRRPRWGLLFIAAFFGAIGFYTYNGAAAFVPTLPFAMLISLVLHRFWPVKQLKAPPITWRIFFIYSLALTLLMLSMFIRLAGGESPEAERSVRLLVFNQGDTFEQGMQLLLENFWAYAQSFLALGGDHRWYSNLPGRPILNPLLAASFFAGVIICLKRMRQFPYLFLLTYWGATVLPAALTLTGDIISAFNFRMSGALPATYVLVAIAWVEVYGWLRTRLLALQRFQHTAAGFALAPFLLVTLVWLPLDTYRAYFVDWANHPEVASAHDAQILALADRMEREKSPNTIFILPRDAREPRPNYTLDFMYHGQTPLRYVLFDEETIRPALTSAVSGYQIIHLITYLEGGRERLQHRATSHALITFLLGKYGDLLQTEETEAYTIQTYRLESAHVDFEAHQKQALPPDFKPLSFVIGDVVKLIGIKQVQTDETLFVDLAWEGWVHALDLKTDYTVFVQLFDKNGQRVAGVDVLPEKSFRQLDWQEIMITHYTVPLPAETPHNDNQLYIGLYYFDENQQIVNVGAITLPTAAISD